MVTLEQLKKIMLHAGQRTDLFLAPLNEAMELYDISTTARQAMFLANVCCESGSLIYTTELWGPTPAQVRYEGRADLGNTQPGDGKRFRGHGLIQTTGRFNHARVRDRLRAKFPDRDVPDFELTPEKLAEVEWAALSAADFWDEHNINKYADAGDFDGACDMVNRGRKTIKEGDANGFIERDAAYRRAKEVLA